MSSRLPVEKMQILKEAKARVAESPIASNIGPVPPSSPGVRVLAYLRRPFSSKVVGQYEEVLQIDYAVEVQISDNGVNRQRTNQHHQGDSSD